MDVHLTMIDASGLDTGDAATATDDSDPLFYQGKSPVLGQDITLRTAGTIPGDFGGVAGPGPAPTAPTAPTVPDMPGFPGFEFSGFGDLPGAPTPPGVPGGDLTPAAQRFPWWAGALALAQKGGGAAGEVNKLLPSVEGGPMKWGPQPGMFSLTGAPDQPWFGEGGNFSLNGAEDAPALNANRFNLIDPTISPGVDELGNPIAAAAGDTPGLGASILNVGGPAVQAAGGLYGAATAPTMEGRVTSGLQAAGGIAGLIGALAPEGSSLAELGLGAAGPAMALSALPVVLGKLYNAYFGPDEAAWGKGGLSKYIPIPGNANQAVDPETGAILEYHGKGRYAYAAQTLQGQRVTPDQFQQWGILPLGDLAASDPYKAAAMAVYRANPAEIATRTPGAVQLYDPDQTLLTQALAAQGGRGGVPAPLQGDVQQAGNTLIPGSTWDTLVDPWGTIAQGGQIPGAAWQDLTPPEAAGVGDTGTGGDGSGAGGDGGGSDGGGE